jgi:hypothetical protein
MKHKFRFYFQGYSGVSLGLIGCGLGCFAIGLADSLPLATTIGGTLFGASLGAFFGRLANMDINEATNDTHDKIVKMFELSQINSLTSEEALIKDLRLAWHVYLVTKIDGNFYWRHAVFDFSKVSIPGRLEAVIIDQNPTSKKTQHLRVEGGVRGSRLVMLLSAMEGKEIAIYVFPSVEQHLDAVYCGVSCITTWDKTSAISPAIMSESPIQEDTSKIDNGVGATVTDIETIKKLNKAWKMDMKNLGYDLLKLPEEDKIGG